MVPRKAYIEDVPEGDDSQTIAVIEQYQIPPRAPTPPPAPEVLPESVNVFDFLVSEETPNGRKSVVHAPAETQLVEHPVYYTNGDSQFSQYSEYTPADGSQHYMSYGFSYGHSPIPPSMDRYESWHNLAEPQQANGAIMPPPYVTPAPKEHRKETKEGKRVTISEKKRKRQLVEDLDLASTKRPSSRDEMMVDAYSGGRVLHSGLTGGLTKLVTDPEFYQDRIDAGPTPILSPVKRSRRDDDSKDDRRKSRHISYGSSTTTKQSSSKPSSDKHDKKYHDDRYDRKYHDDKHHRSRSAERIYHEDKHRHRRHREQDSMSSDDRGTRKTVYRIEYPGHIDRPGSVQPNATNQLVSYSSRADLFMSFVNKGPDSERGCSINKVLKRYHRERDVRGESKDEEDKELWKALRLRKNERGEIVLFVE